MEINTGAAVSIIVEDTFKALLPCLTLFLSSVVLRSYTYESIPVMGEAQVTVQHVVTTCEHSLAPILCFSGNQSSDTMPDKLGLTTQLHMKATTPPLYEWLVHKVSSQQR